MYTLNDINFKIRKRIANGRKGPIMRFGLTKRRKEFVVAKYINMKLHERRSKELPRALQVQSWITQQFPPHPNISRVYGLFPVTKLVHDTGSDATFSSSSGEENIEYFQPKQFVLLQEYKHGYVNLYDYLNKIGLPLAHKVNVMMQIASAVDHLHAHGICHMDLKPDNVLIHPHTKACTLIDFEFACHYKIPDDKNAFYFPFKNDMLGTVDFMAHELILDTPIEQADVPKIDIYALGVTFYVLANNDKGFDSAPIYPYNYSGLCEFLKKLGPNVPQRPSDSKCPALDYLIMQMISYNAESRPEFSTIKNSLSTILASFD